MKIPFTAKYPRPFVARSRSGVALLLVLSVVAILLLFITGFLMMVQTETRSAGAYAKGEETRVLTDLPLNLVIAQVRKATENNGSTKTWASQPGMIRVFGQDVDSTTQRTKLERAYKLYSAEQMEATADGSGIAPQINATTEVPSDWDSKVAMFTDLNAPVYTSHDSSGKPTNPVYPIADPAAFTDQSDAVGSTKRLDGVELVDTSGLEKLPKSSAANANPLPMPVRWLYILQDGTISAGTDAGDPKKIRVTGASATNPITGRIAFWTDDECSKVNINTASEGVFWDKPLGDTNMERGGGAGIGADPTSYAAGSSNLFGFAAALPVRNEFTRYPGHPSRTCLSSVLGPWLPLSATPTPTELDQYYRLTPRVALGGTKAGTVLSTNGTNVGLNPLDKDRLYASTDELVFAPNRSMESSALTAPVLARTRFFLTAHSRAPEVNLFNKPRMALWPFSSDPNYRNAVDKLIAFASTCAQQPFYFQRSRCTNDATNNSSSDPTEDYDSVTRNRQLYAYFQAMSQNNIPGFGGSFKAKYGDDSDQILTEMFDYLRGHVNYKSAGLAPTYEYTTGGGSAGGERWIAPLKITTAQGTDTRGFGRFATITEAALVFTGDDTVDPATGKKQMDASGYAKKVQCFLVLQLFRPTPGFLQLSPSMRIEISGMDSFKLGGQPLGFPADATMKANSSGNWSGWGSSQAYQNLMSLFRTGNQAVRKSGTPPTNSDADQLGYYPFVSQVVTLPAGGTPGQMSFTGSSITIKLSTGTNPAPGKLIQTLTMDFSGDTPFPAPKIQDAANDKQRLLDGRLAKIATLDYNSTPASTGAFGGAYYNALSYYCDHRQITVNSEDVVRSVQVDPAGPSGGDFRLLAATPNVPTSWFKKNTKWGSSDTLDRNGHSLREERWLALGQTGYNPRGDTNSQLPEEVDSGTADYAHRPSSWSTGGALVKGLKYASSAVPIVPCGMDGALNSNARPGDWENGLSIYADGPFIRGTVASSYTQRAAGLYTFGYDSEDQSAEGVNFTPNLQIASAVAFGALPTGVKAMHPWQTLLFCPNPPSRSTVSTKTPTTTDHAGFGSPHDNLYLDLFWMPVAEPYAISEPFSTAGKVNMNCDIYPFRYIKRRTAVCAVLKNTRVTAIPPDLAKDQTTGKSDNYKGLNRCKYDFRYAVNLDAVTGSLSGFEARFKTGDVFRSSAEICDLYLVPSALAGAAYHPNVPALPIYTTIGAWWNKMTLTGDNARENPYNDIYPRLTTKSNVYQVHYRVQLLRKARSTDPAVWDEDRDQTAGEQRGSVIFERYLDPGDRAMPDLASSTQFADPAYNVDRYYRHRVIERKQFAP